MVKKSNRFYQTKDILLAYVTTVNPDSYTIEGQIVKTIIAFRKENYGKNIKLIPVDDNFMYYSVDRIVPISSKRKKASTFISSEEIDKIVEFEKENQQNLIINKSLKGIELLKNDEKTKIDAISEELDINKVKKLVA